MISQDCDVESFIRRIADLPYHEVLVAILNEGYATDDLIAHQRRDGASEEDISRAKEYSKFLRDIIYLLQTGLRPDYVSKKDVLNYNKFCPVACSLVERGELMPEIMDFFDL
jgi:hypothetical protein